MSSSLHEHQNARLFDYLEGVLTAEERGEFERHLEGCESCREELRLVRRLDEAVAEIPEPKLPVKFFDNLNTALDNLDNEPKISIRTSGAPTVVAGRAPRRRPGWYVALLVGGILLILAAVWALRLG